MLRYSIDEWKKYHIKIEANVIDKIKTDIRQYTYFLIGALTKTFCYSGKKNGC